MFISVRTDDYTYIVVKTRRQIFIIIYSDFIFDPLPGDISEIYFNVKQKLSRILLLYEKYYEKYNLMKISLNRSFKVILMSW